MANATPSRLGQINASGDDRQLFLKMFSGETLNAFHNTTEFRPRVQSRTIPSGKSAQFLVMGRANARFHTPGTEITGSPIKQAERIITIEDILLADTFIANVDELLSQYDARGDYAVELGDVLAQAYDLTMAQTGIMNARGAAVVDGLPGGATVNNAAFSTDGNALWQGIYGAGITLDTKFVPTADRTAYIRPVQHALVVQSGMPIDVRYNGMRENGSISRGDIKMINDIDIIKTNNLDNRNLIGDALTQAIRQHDYSPTQALIQHRSATGVVQLQDITMESQYDVRRQGTLMVAKYLIGAGSLRPEAGVELRTADPVG
jgi:hypothetical protein